MLKNKIKIVTISILIIFVVLLCGCSISKYNTYGKFDSKESMELYKEKKYDEAIKSVDSFLEKYPRNKTAISQKGYILIGSGKNQAGLILLTDLYEKNAGNSAVLNNISWGYNNLHMYEMSNKYIDLCLKISPGDDEEYCNKGNALHGMKKNDEALIYYDKALKKNPKSTFALYGKGLCFYEKKEYTECLVWFKKYKELKADDKSVNHYITSAYLNQKDFDGAINEYTNQIKNNPDDVSLYFSLGGIYTKQGDFNKAINCYDSIIKKKPDYADAYYEKSICLVKLGKKDEACENLKIAIKYDEEYIYDIQDEPEFDPLRNYDKFKVLLHAGKDSEY